MSHSPSPSHLLIGHSGMKLSLEIMVASLADSSTVRYFVVREDITGWECDPDKIALELLDSPELDFPEEVKNNCFVHSTSWRFEPRQTIVLTYLVYSDLLLFRKNPGKLLSLHDTAISSSNHLHIPRPPEITETHVLSHGIRHLSQLVKNNCQNVRSILTPQSLQIFQEMEGDLSGRIN
jgi:hypothetical protein